MQQCSWGECSQHPLKGESDMEVTTLVSIVEVIYYYLKLTLFLNESKL